MRRVLICDDNQYSVDTLVKGLQEEDIPALGVRYIEDAAEILFSTDPPAVFIADLKGKLRLTQADYEALYGQLNEDEERHGGAGISDYIREVQNRIPDLRIVLISILDPVVNARDLGVFAYGEKGSKEDMSNLVSNLARVCSLGPLRENEVVPITGKLKESPLDLCSNDDVNRYIERKFSVNREREV